MSYNELERIDMVLAERVIAAAQLTSVLPTIEISVMIHEFMDNLTTCRTRYLELEVAMTQFRSYS